MSRRPRPVRRVRRALGFNSQAAACQMMRAEGLNGDQIAILLGGRRVIDAEPLRRGFGVVDLTIDVAVALKAPALARGMDVPELALLLLEQIARDDLCDALLGEPGEAE